MDVSGQVRKTYQLHAMRGTEFDHLSYSGLSQGLQLGDVEHTVPRFCMQTYKLDWNLQAETKQYGPKQTEQNNLRMEQ